MLSYDFIDIDGEEHLYLAGMISRRERKWRNPFRKSHEELEELVRQRTNELMQANEALTRLSQIDGLTGISNRRYFDEYLNVNGSEVCGRKAR